jgi:FMN reductase
MNGKIARSNLLIVGLGGGLGGESHSLTALKIALEAAKQAGAQTELIDLQSVRLPFFEPSLELKDYPASVKDYIDRMARADGYLWASPAYHGTISGVVKNALDFIEFLSDRTPPYLDGKPVGLISTAGGSMAGVTTLQALMHTAHALRAWVVPLTIAVPGAWRSIDNQGRLTDTNLESRLQALGREVVQFIAQK